MQRLWAPWRLDYVRSSKENGCFLCHAMAGKDDRANLILKRGVTCCVIINRYPYNNGHLMICPFRHVSSLSDMTSDERLETMNLTTEAVTALTGAMHPDGFNIGINLGQAAGAGLVDHIHTHIVPRWGGDTNFMPVFSDTKVVPQSLDDLWRELHPLLNP